MAEHHTADTDQATGRASWGRRLLGSLALAVALAGCTERLNPAGEATTEPFLGYASYTAADGVRRTMRWWDTEAAPRAVIVALHGYNDYSRAFAIPGEYLAEVHGIAVAAFDQRGFGGGEGRGVWAGEETLKRDLETVLELVRDEYPGTPVYLLGESMGGAVALTALTDPFNIARSLVDGTILVAPAVWGKDQMLVHERFAVNLAQDTIPGIYLIPQGLRVTPTDNYKVLRELSADSLVIKGSRIDTLNGLIELMTQARLAANQLTTPSLVLFGAREDILPDGEIEEFVADLPTDLPPDYGHKVVRYPDGYHMLLRDTRGEIVLDDIAAWIEDRIAPLPSEIALAGAADAAADMDLSEVPPDEDRIGGVTRRRPPLFDTRISDIRLFGSGKEEE